MAAPSFACSTRTEGATRPTGDSRKSSWATYAERCASPTAAGDEGGAEKRYKNAHGAPSGTGGRRLGAGALLCLSAIRWRIELLELRRTQKRRSLLRRIGE